MFGLLKKKIASFIDTLTQKEEEKPEEPAPDAQIQPSTPPVPPEARPAAASQTEATATPEPTTAAKQPESKPTGATPETRPVSKQIETRPADDSFFPSAKPQTPATPTAPAVISKPVQPPQPAQTQPNAVGSTSVAPSTPKPVPAPAAPKPIPTSAKPQAITPAPIASAPQPHKTSPQTQTPQAASKPVLPAHDEPKTAAPIPRMETAPAPSSSSKSPTPQISTPGERKLTAKLGLFSQIKGLIIREVQIQPSELEPMLDELNMALLESDVTLDTADHIVATIKTQLAGRKVDKSRVQAEIQAAVKTALMEVLDKPSLDVVDYVRQHDKPVKILFLGPNGAGKTTTLAKIAHYLKQNGLHVVLAAGDTFRAAAIEQLQHHGSAIGVPVIKHQYGADPSAVAFDAIAHAKAHGADVVLIDTAGRQETNFNLLKEMEKINRVVQPDLKLFIGEAVAGHALVEQAKAFHAALKLDGVVLTKVDCDAKGGTSFSVSHEVGVPIVLLGTGQQYGDIRTFDAAWLVSNVLAE